MLSIHLMVQKLSTFPASIEENCHPIIWNAQTGAILHNLIDPEGHEYASCAEFSRNGLLVATGYFDGFIKIWNVSTGEHVRTINVHIDQDNEEDQNNAVTTIQFSPNGNNLLTAFSDGASRVFNVANGLLLHTLEGHTDLVSFAQFSPDGTKIVTASNNKTAKIWQSSTGALLVNLRDHQAQLYSAQFSRDSSKVVTACQDGNVKVWLSLQGKLITEMKVSESPLLHADFSQDGKYIVITSADQSAHILSLAKMVAYTFFSSPVLDLKYQTLIIFLEQLVKNGRTEMLLGDHRNSIRNTFQMLDLVIQNQMLIAYPFIPEVWLVQQQKGVRRRFDEIDN